MEIEKRTKNPENLEPDFVPETVRVSCSSVVDYLGYKNYRTVYCLEELKQLYVDAEWLCRKCDGKEREMEVVVALFRVEGDKSVCIAQQGEQVKIPGTETRIRYEALFAADRLPAPGFSEGVYGVVVQLDEVAAQSDHIFLMKGNNLPSDYFRVTEVGLDKCCEETEQEAKIRPHSFQVLDIHKLKDVRFYLLAENMLPREWVYEFIIHLSDQAGVTKALRVVKGKHYIKDQEGHSFLCFAAELGEGMEDFWCEGGFTLRVICFGRLLMTLNFTIGSQEIPYRFEAEMTGKEVEVSAAIERKDKEEVLDRLYRLVGLRKVKEEITRIFEQAEFICMRQQNGFNDVFPLMHLLFTGHPGTGKNTVAALIGEIFCSLGILSHGKIYRCGRKELVREGYAAEEQLVRRVMANSTGGVLFIDGAADFYRAGEPADQGMATLTILSDLLRKEKPELLVILADEGEEMAEMLAAYPDLSSCFTKQLCFEDYLPEELLEITKGKLENRQLRFSAAAEEKFFRILKSCYDARELDFSNGRFIDEQIEEMALRMAKRLMANRDGNYSKEEMMLIRDEDIVVETAPAPGESYDKLNAMMGAGPLKQSIIHHLNYIYFIRERRKQGFDDVMPPLNMLFSGNPGTGKTTVAKMLGDIYYSAGILARPNVLVQNGRNLAVETGIPPEQVVTGLLQATDGGILYIDRACTLIKSASGLALFELLLASLSAEEYDENIVILADLPGEIEKMLEINPGLKAWFPHQFQFKDYEPEELMEIAVRKLKEKKYAFHPKAKEAFELLIRKVCQASDQNFGNALWVDKLVGMIIRNLSNRGMKIREERELTRKELTTVMVADIPTDTLKVPELNKDIFNENEITLALKELDQLVGQGKIKKQIRDFVELARHYSQLDTKLNSRISLQWCFTGNSGFGKGTVARIIARIYKAMGIIEQAVVCDFKVEKLIGQTEEEAQRMLGDALLKSNGGIFLFDEDSRKLSGADAFRERVRAILVNQMAEKPGAYTVIYAGQQPTVQSVRGEVEKMADMVNVLVFEDYTKEDLMQVLKRKLQKESMKLTHSAQQCMALFIERLMANEERNHSSARLMRVVVELMIRNTIQRMSKAEKRPDSDQPISIVKSDVEMFNEALIVEWMDERKKIGFRTN